MATKKGSALSRPVNISDDLAAIVGKGPMPRTEITKQLWVYIKKHDLQDPNDRRQIKCDEKLKKVFPKGTVHMLEIPKLVNKHIS